jgi:MarR family transcriptional regulator, organic hydroperoxide resistance regulator
VTVSQVPVGDRLGVQLYLASRAIAARYRLVLADHDLTYPQHLVLSLLGERGELSVADIGAELLLTSNTLSPLLKRLAVRGLVRRRRDRSDERIVRIRLSPEGTDVHDRCSALDHLIATDTGLTDRQYTQLVRRLRVLATTLALPDPKQTDGPVLRDRSVP